MNKRVYRLRSKHETEDEIMYVYETITTDYNLQVLYPQEINEIYKTGQLEQITFDKGKMLVWIKVKKRKELLLN